MNKKFLTIGVLLLVAATVSAASIMFFFPYSPQLPPLANETGSTKEGIQQVVSANNKFAFDLYSELANAENGNIFYSPYSIFSAMAMTYEGAKGQTANEIKSVFHFPESDVLRPNFAAIYNDINKGTRNYELKTGNALWAQYNYTFLDDYMNRVENYYGGKAANLDFIGNLEESIQTINSFIEEQTNNKIKNLIPQGTVDASTRLVLTNAIYFRGTWTWKFAKSDTSEQDFKITPTNVIKTPMMYMDNDKAKFNYADLGDFQILELPYKGEEISMLIILPTENLDVIKTSLTAENLEEWRSEMQETKLDAIYLPKFEFDTKYFMENTLAAMGMPTAFTWPGVDFSGMDGTNNLYISTVIHQAFIKVDEEGTEAAAATAIGMTMGAAGPRSVFMADHPFIFILQERSTGNILFLGRVVDPRG